MFEDEKEIIHDDRHFNEDNLTNEIYSKDLTKIIYNSPEVKLKEVKSAESFIIILINTLFPFEI